jgi:fumarate reductase subunit D
MSQTQTLHVSPGVASKILAGMSYLGILSLVPLVLNRDDNYIRFHARQGVVLWMWEVLAIYSLVVPGIGRAFFGISGLVCFILSVIGIASVLLGRAWKMPLIGKWAESI